MNDKTEARRAWVAFMAAAMYRGDNMEACAMEACAARADMALALYRQRYPALPANWQQTLDPL